MQGANGEFTLEVPGENSVLVISFVSYVKQEIPVGRNRIFRIILQEDQQLLDELIVVGYGTQKKANLTGAVGTVSADELTTRVMPNTESLLQGRIPGLQITQNSGQPGAENNAIQIRGMGTFSAAGNNPLVLIDGVEGDMNKVNPNMIESVTVLKDAASSAIYGSRAANGVILLTTRNGREGRLNIDFSYNFSLQTPSMKQKRITDSVEFMELMTKAVGHTKDGLGKKDYTYEEIEAYRQGRLTNPDQYPSTDWIDEVTRTAPMHQYFLGVNGGKGGTSYNFGAGVVDQQGVMIKTGFKKYDIQFNMTTNLGGRVTFGTNINFATSDRYEPAVTSGSTPEDIINFNATEDQMLCAYAQSPLFKPYLPDGSGRFSAYAYPDKGGNKNPVAIANNGSKKEFKEYYLLASAFMNVKILEGLQGEVKASVKYNDTQARARTISTIGYAYHPDANGEHNQVSVWNSTDNQLAIRNAKDVQYTFFATLNYKKNIQRLSQPECHAGV
ncbi:MAG: SusC/RagA family TonB-linked outer membrane protein [Bacteroides sp.]|nr:SusC/RagA family TonB-linked outer membrane protein [Bacteroides sp.]